MLLIKNGYMIDPKSGREGKYDILTARDRIMKIGKGLEKPEGKCRVIDAGGLLVAPGLVDVHVHFRDPGFPRKEDIHTGAAAAARGGFTTVVMMANTKPCIDNPQTLRSVLEKGRAGEIYNIGGNNEKANIEIVRLILRALDKPESLITYVRDRPGHDRRYAIDNTKITTELGWAPAYTFEEGMKETIRWYLDHPGWVERVTSGEYQRYYEKMYQ